MKTYLYRGVEYIARIHDKLMTLNDSFEFNYNDKQLHFLIIGILGMIMVIATHIVFKWLAKHNHILTISWIYVFTLLLVITFSIEIGQGITKTGTMDFGDIVYGLGGFILFFAVYALIRGIIKGIAKLIKEEKTGRE